MLETDLLIIDDLGTEYKNQFTAAMLYNTINTRLLKRRATIISTNFTFDDLERDYDQRITSRLTGEYSPLVLEGGDITKEAWTGDGAHVNSGFLNGLNKQDAIDRMAAWLEEHGYER